MPPVAIPMDVTQSVDVEPQTAESKSGKPIVGIIYPPPEIRNIVDKTASFVARNGGEFETRIRQHEINNPKFNFLNSNDPYHTYYQHKVREFVEGKAVECSIPRPAAPVAPQKVQEAVKASEFIPKEPPQEFEFVADPATINAFDL
ncbi:unnamed protein product [Soboliphyme baturini]|uniref:SURP motif domain-containing protein n=1 Tax=Soboliphyme baturini TaxID=241478 RepID=A0A183IXZ6_9BILA|nr:unnamed protein product [Soboliphyme baturini]